MAKRRVRFDRTPTPLPWMARLRRIAAILLLLVAVAFTGLMLVARAVAAEGDAPIPALEGRYDGLGSALGMKLRIIEAGAAPAGLFIDSNGREAPFGGGWKDGALEAVLDFPGRPVFVRISPASLGAQMTVLPLDAEGRPLQAEARLLAFLREGVAMPEQPALYMDPPARADGESDPDVFLASYQFWPPDGAARGFAQIGARYRTMIRFFPQVHADVLWKLCDAEEGRALVAEALRGQGADCAAVSGTVETLQREGRFPEWKRAVQAEIDAIMPSVQCARGYVVRTSVCEPAARRVAEAAASMETVGTLLARWR